MRRIANPYASQLNKAINKGVAASTDGIEDGKYVRVFCAYETSDTPPYTPTLTFICPFCGKRHTHGYTPGHRRPHCPTCTYSRFHPNKYRLDAESIRDQFADGDPMKNGYVLVPTDDFSKIGSVPSKVRKSLITIEEANRLIEGFESKGSAGM